MTVGLISFGLPRGSLVMTRRSCSNCEVWQASRVWWPELWGRGGKLVDEEAAVGGEEELHGENADVIEFLGDLGGDRGGVAQGALRESGRDDGEVEDVIAVDVLGGIEGDHLTAGGAGHDDGKFCGEGDLLLEHGAGRAKICPELVEIIGAGALIDG